MTAYEPDPQVAKLFVQHKTAAQTVKRTRKPVLTAAEDAIRQGATNQQLAELTGMSDETFRKLAEKIGVDNRQKAPTVGREVEAAKAHLTQPPTQEFAKPAPNIRNLTGADARHLAEVAAGRAPERAAYYDRIAHTSPYGYYSVVEAALRVEDLRKSDLDN